MKVIVPSMLQSYTGAREVTVEVEEDRIRPHVRFFVNGELVSDLSRPLGPGDVVQIVQALSGG